VQLDVAIALLDREFRSRGDALGIAVFEQAGIARQRGLSCPAEQAMERQVGGLAGDVPKRDVEARQRKDRDAVAAEQMQLLLQIAR